MPAAATPASSRRARRRRRGAPDAQGRRARGRVRDGRVLLVRERSDGGWTLPAGWADIGEPPAAAALRELREESGWDGPRRQLFAVHDRDRHNFPAASAAHLQAVLPLRADRRRAGWTPRQRGGRRSQFFGRDALPEQLSTGRTTQSQLEAAFAHYADPVAADRVRLVDQADRHPPDREPPDHERRTRSARRRGRGRPRPPSRRRRGARARRSGSSGLSCASTCAHSGSPSIGKNVPATRNSGVSTRADDVVEVLDRLQRRGDRDAEARPAEAGDEADERHGQHAPARVEPEDHRHEQRRAAERPGPRRDPQRLGGDELLGVHRRGEDRVVGALELVLDEGRRTSPGRPRRTAPRSRPCRCRRTRRSRSRRPRDQRAEAEPEREQVDRRLDGRGERRRAPEEEKLMISRTSTPASAGRSRRPSRAGRVSGATAHSAISSPVSSTKTSSRFAGRRSPVGRGAVGRVQAQDRDARAGAARAAGRPRAPPPRPRRASAAAP